MNRISNLIVIQLNSFPWKPVLFCLALSIIWGRCDIPPIQAFPWMVIVLFQFFSFLEYLSFWPKDSVIHSTLPIRLSDILWLTLVGHIVYTAVCVVESLSAGSITFLFASGFLQIFSLMKNASLCFFVTLSNKLQSATNSVGRDCDKQLQAGRAQGR